MKIQIALQGHALVSERAIQVVQLERVRRTAIHPETVQEMIKTATNLIILRDDHVHREKVDAIRIDQVVEAVTVMTLPLTTQGTRKRKVIANEVKGKREIVMMNPLIEKRSDRRERFRYPRYQPMKPPKFDGRTSLDEFVIAFENCARFNAWSAEDKAAYLMNSLTGSAAQLLRDSADCTYKELIKKLERRYGTKNQQERYRTEIRCRRRKKEEPVTELAEAIRGLMMLAYPGDQTDEICMTIARDAFLAALNDPEMEEKIRHQEPRDLDEACRIAQSFEVIRNAVQATSADQKVHRARPVSDVPDTFEEQRREENEQKQKRFSGKERFKKQWSDNRASKAEQRQEVAANQGAQPVKDQGDLVKDLVKQCADKDKAMEELRRAEKQLLREKEELQKSSRS